MKVMSSSKEPGETQQQSYFYVVWPEDKSPGGSNDVAATTVSTAATSAVVTSTPISTAALPTFNYDTQTLATGSSGSSTSSTTQQESPVGSPMNKDLASMASNSVQVMAANTMDSSTRLTPDGSAGSRVKSQPLQHVAATVPGNMIVASSTFGIPSQDSFTVTAGRHRTVATPDLTSTHSGKQRLHQGIAVNSIGESNLRDIGAAVSYINSHKSMIAPFIIQVCLQSRLSSI